MAIDLDLDDSLESPFARLRRVGMDSLSDAEVLALAAGRGRGGLDALRLAAHVLGTHDGVRGLARAGLGMLSPDLGAHRSARLIASFELARRARAVPLSPRARFGSSADVVRAYGPRLRDATEELVIALVLDARERLVAERVLAHGGASSCALGMREVFTLVVREGGDAVVLLHNHPSGDPRPSEEDIRFTRGMLDAGQLLDLELLDHVIVGREGSFSFRDSGLLAPVPSRRAENDR